MTTIDEETCELLVKKSIFSFDDDLYAVEQFQFQAFL